MEGYYRFVECELDYVAKYPLATEYTEEDDYYYCEGKNELVSSYDCASPEECRAANQRELDIYETYGQLFECLCPINLAISNADCLYMDRAELLEEYKPAIFHRQKHNADAVKVYADAISEAREYKYPSYFNDKLVSSFAALVLEHVLDFHDVIAFFDELDALYYEQDIDLYEDLHDGNIGILNGKPVIIDYAGTEEIEI